MLPNKVHVSKNASDILKKLKTRLGLTPNIIARMAFCHSIEVRNQGDQYDGDLGGLEFSKAVLFGEYELLYEALLIDQHGPLEEIDVGRTVAGHIELGLRDVAGTKTIEGLLHMLKVTA